MPVAPRNLDVAVDGGELRGRLWSGQSATGLVVAVHGITSNHLAWAKVAQQLPAGIALAAPDLRGRVRSAHLPGPWGMRRHAEDLLAVLDHLGAERVVLAGHSMGAWVVLMVALAHPERIAGLVLVDGGVSLPVPEGATTDEVLAAVLGPALDRLGTTYASRDEYLAAWARHPAFASGFDRPTREYLLADLVGSGFVWRSSVRSDAVHADGAELLVDAEVRGALAAVIARGDLPITLLRAPKGLLDEPSPLIPLAATERWSGAATFALDTVPDTNHYSILLGDDGATAVSAVLAAAVAAAP